MTDKKRFQLIDKAIHKISGAQFTTLMNEYFKYIDKYDNNFDHICEKYQLNNKEVLFWFEAVRTHKDLTFKNIG